MLSLKGYNSDVWSSEIYTADNRFGRYQSHASAQVIGIEGALKSGYTQEGWDWNRYPGVTSIHLPFEILDSPIKGTLMAWKKKDRISVQVLQLRPACSVLTTGLFISAQELPIIPPILQKRPFIS